MFKNNFIISILVPNLYLFIDRYYYLLIFILTLFVRRLFDYETEKNSLKSIFSTRKKPWELEGNVGQCQETTRPLLQRAETIAYKEKAEKIR
jgi:hypothetical protein